MTTVEGTPPASASGVPAPVGNFRHGTNAGYVAHRKRRTRPCLSCYAANARYQRAYRILNGQRVAVHLPITAVAALLDGGNPLVILAEALGGEVVDAIEIRTAMDRSIR